MHAQMNIPNTCVDLTEKTLSIAVIAITVFERTTSQPCQRL